MSTRASLHDFVTLQVLEPSAETFEHLVNYYNYADFGDPTNVCGLYGAQRQPVVVRCVGGLAGYWG